MDEQSRHLATRDTESSSASDASTAPAVMKLDTRFRAFFEQNTQYAWLITLDGTLVDINRTSLQAVNMDAAQLAGKKLWEFGFWQSLPVAIDTIQKAIARAAVGEQTRQKISYLLPAKTDNYLDLTLMPLTDEHQQVNLIAVTGVDITEQHRLELAFNTLRTRFESMLTAAEVATWTWDAETNHIIADRNLVQLFSVPMDRAESASLSDYYAAIHPDDIERVKALSRKAIADGSLFESRYRVRSIDGSYRTVIARGRAQYDSNGQAISFPGVVLDITSQAQAENELQLSNQRYSTLIDLMDEGFCVLEIIYDDNNQPYDYRFEEVNQAFEKQTGLIAPVGKTARNLVPNLEMDWVETYGRVAATGKPMRFQMESQALGRTFDVYASRQGGPESHRVSLIFSDITARKFAEEALRNHANSLMESNRRKSEFLATLAHELRNPLAPLKNGVQLLHLNSHNPEAVVQVRSMMERQLNQMVRLVDDLLDIARINSGKIELKTAPVTLGTIVTSAVETSLPFITAQNHQLSLEIHNDAVPLNADATRLAQVLSNLLNNAAKYTPASGDIRLASWDDGIDLFIAVKDNGIGLTDECIASVFEMFSQVGRSLTQAQGGLGIGLSLVRQIVELHGGQVTAQSAGRGLGSTFLVRLPMLLAPPLVEKPALIPDTLLRPTTSRLRILVVDDNADAAESLSLLLALTGHQAMVANDGAEALEKAQRFIPHIAFLDIGLPGMDGYQLAQALRAIPELHQLRLVALTGWGGKEDREKTAAAGFAEHLTKPTSFDDIQTILAHFQSDAV